MLGFVLTASSLDGARRNPTTITEAELRISFHFHPGDLCYAKRRARNRSRRIFALYPVRCALSFSFCALMASRAAFHCASLQCRNS
jgi:hypothetical protein